jgi:hypothetical protein
MPTLGELQKVLRYDPGAAKFYWLNAYHTSKIGSEAGSFDVKGYRRIQVFGRSIKVHRLVWLYETGEWPSLDIDHINGDRSDNRFCNLRLATKGQNAQNYPLHANNRCGLHGVSWVGRVQKWRAMIRVDGKQRYVGMFKSPEDAHAAYLRAKVKFHPFQPIPRDINAYSR